MATARPLTVFCHFYNEEFLLPYWVRHHRRLFDHGVLVDRRSTDRSVEIVRRLAPGWEVVPSRNPIFDARDCDMEMMHHERRYDGWKLVLNVTEFVFHDDLRGAVERFAKAHPDTAAIAIPMVLMVDRAEDADTPVGDEDLFLQRFRGLSEEASQAFGDRFLHREVDGRYTAGRHGTRLPYARSDELLVQRFDWSPYARIRQRKLQIGAAIPESDIRQGMSWHHLFTPDDLDARFAIFAGVTGDLRTNERYQAMLGRLRVRAATEAAADQASTTSTVPVEPAPVGRSPESVPPRRVAILVADAEAAQRFTNVLEGEHEVRVVVSAGCESSELVAPAEWADVVVVEYEVLRAHPLLLDGHAALAVDLADSAPDEPLAPVAVSVPWDRYAAHSHRPLGERLLLRGDLFLCPAPERFPVWADHLQAAGRVPFAPDGNARLDGLLETDIDAFRTFCHEPRRVTGRIAQDATLIVSGEAYRQQATHWLWAHHASLRFRAAYEALAAEYGRLAAAHAEAVERANAATVPVPPEPPAHAPEPEPSSVRGLLRRWQLRAGRSGRS